MRQPTPLLEYAKTGFARTVGDGKGGPKPDVPTAQWTKADIIDWLRGEGIEVTKKATRTLSKDELLTMAKHVRDYP